MEKKTKMEWENIEDFRRVYENNIQFWISKLKDAEIKGSAIFNEDIPETKEKWEKIKLIIVADNPGNKEAIEKRYLVGGAGEIARAFFKITFNDLRINMKENVLVLNKTPINSSNTSDLKNIYNNIKGKGILNDTQEWMAKTIYKLHQILECDLWIIGSGNFEKIFEKFKETINGAYNESENEKWKRVFVFKHFSYGWFFRDFEKYKKNEENLKNGENLKEYLKKIGTEKRVDIFGW